MPLSRIKTWIAGEVLTASDLNAEFNNVIDNHSFALSTQFANGSLSAPSIAFLNDTDTGAYLAGANQVALVAGGAPAFVLTRAASAGTAFALFSRGKTDSDRFYPALTFGGQDDGLTAISAGTLDLIAAGRRVLQASAYANATNYVLVAPAQAGLGPILGSAGADTNIPLFLVPKGTGYVRVPVGSLTEGERYIAGLGVGSPDVGLTAVTGGTLDLIAGGRRVLQASGYVNATNYVLIVPAQAGQPPVVTTGGADTNASLSLRGKGTGYVTASNFVLENFAATQSPTITGRMYWQSAEGAVHISAGTLMARVPALTGVQAGELIGATNPSGVDGATVFSRIQLGSGLSMTGTSLSASGGIGEASRLVFETSTKLNLASGYVPLKVDGEWERRVISTVVELLAPAVSSNTLYYIYAYDNSGTTTLEASTTAPVTATLHGIRVKSGDESRTLVGMAFAGTGGAFTNSGNNSLVASWFNRKVRVATSSFSTNRTTASTTPVELNTEIRCHFAIWDDEVVSVGATLTVANPTNDGATSHLGFDVVFPHNNLGSQVSAAASVTGPSGISYHKLGLTEGTHYVTLLGRTSLGGTGTWLSDATGGRYCAMSVRVG